MSTTSLDVHPEELLSGSFSSLSNLPDFDSQEQKIASLRTPHVDVQNWRRAARAIAAKTSPQEHRYLLDERKALLVVKYNGSMSPDQQARLEYVRWSLDRIEDAKHGSELDDIEDTLSRYETVLKELQSLHSKLEDNRRGSRR